MTAVHRRCEETAGRSLGRRLAALLLLVVAGATAGGCILEGKATSWNERDESVGSGAKGAKVRNRYGAVVADRGATDALAFIKLPLDLWAPFAVSARFGVFRPERAAGLGEGIFGIELDARGTDPLQFYGIFAQYLQGGLNVFVSKRGPGDSAATNVGQRFFPDTTRVDVTLVHDGANLTFTARPAGSADAPTVVASIPLPQQSPLNPGFGAFRIGDRSEVGFDDFEIDWSGVPPAPVSPQHAAVADLFRIFASSRHVHNLLDGKVAPDVAAAVAALDEALLRAEAARATLGTIPAAKAGSARDEALRRLRTVDKAFGRAKSLLQRRGLLRLTLVLKLLENNVEDALFRAIEAILPDDLLAALPQEH